MLGGTGSVTLVHHRPIWAILAFMIHQLHSALLWTLWELAGESEPTPIPPDRPA